MRRRTVAAPRRGALPERLPVAGGYRRGGMSLAGIQGWRRPDPGPGEKRRRSGAGSPRLQGECGEEAGRGRPGSRGTAEDGDGPTSGREVGKMKGEQEGGGIRRHLAHVSSFVAQPIVFVTCTTAHRAPLLAHEGVHTVLRSIWEESLDRNGWAVGDYVLMPDHVHLFARPLHDGIPLKRWIALWKSLSSRRIAGILHCRPPVWQQDYFDRYLRSGENYADKWAYIEANPVRAGLAVRAADWAYRGQITPLCG
ncbi:MAG: hypothetical protein FJ280_25060 [Planctomycetes bacterium]|nr:hypothetical protein [Planctomycetota bacterium]